MLVQPRKVYISGAVKIREKLPEGVKWNLVYLHAKKWMFFSQKIAISFFYILIFKGKKYLLNGILLNICLLFIFFNAMSYFFGCWVLKGYRICKTISLCTTLQLCSIFFHNMSNFDMKLFMLSQCFLLDQIN